MTCNEKPQDDDFQHESCRLKVSLKSCRKVVANYRALLTDSSNDNPDDESAEIDSLTA